MNMVIIILQAEIYIMNKTKKISGLLYFCMALNSVNPVWIWPFTLSTCNRTSCTHYLTWISAKALKVFELSSRDA